MKRPSRGLRPSQTTIRWQAWFSLPVLRSLILTDIAFPQRFDTQMTSGYKSTRAFNITPIAVKANQQEEFILFHTYIKRSVNQ
jgi:hypothetical protein